MSKKKIELIKIDKKNRNIVFRKESSKFSSFFSKYNKTFLLLILVISLTLLTAGVFVAVSYVPESADLVIKEVSIDTDIDVTSKDVTASISIMSDEYAKAMFQNISSFRKEGEVLLVKSVSKGKYVINFYSDYTAIRMMNDGNSVTKINPVNGDYGIGTNGITDSRAEVLDIRKVKTESYSFGIVTYYSDGSAMISNSDYNMYVRNSDDINSEYISSNKVSYMKNRTNENGVKLEYFYDGTVCIKKGNTKYLVRDINDVTVRGNNITFKYNNGATVYKSLKTNDGMLIEYYTDGGAIITNGNKKLSVRKSNSIIMDGNKIVEIVDNMYVTVSKKTNNIIYYTNGGAVIKNYSGKNIYVSDNSAIRNNMVNDYEILSESRNLSGNKVSLYESTGIVENNVYTVIVHKDSILFNTDGSFKDILVDDDIDYKKPITITNNTNNTIKYRLVIDKSNKTTLDVKYMKYQLLVSGKYMGPSNLRDAYWHKDNVYDSLNIKGTNYVLVERILEPQETDKINVMFWVDYDTIPNSMQDKMFYGTLRLYAWQEIESSI